MSEHKLPLGKELIEWICKLGHVLGYHVEKEYIIDNKRSAVDVAWLVNKNNNHPLFIFEIESKSSNSMVNNPLKIYAQSVNFFEKPLFFFHVVVKGGVKSSRKENLELMYGKENYRIYLMEEKVSNKLVEDIINQHYRVSNDLNYIDLYDFLNEDIWLDDIKCQQILKFAVDLSLSKENIISSYIQISLYDEVFLNDLVVYFSEESRIEFKNIDLNTYMGQVWLQPIVLSLLCGLSEKISDTSHWSSMLLGWQRGHYLPMLAGNAFGLSVDYDEFMLGGAPQLITLCIVLGANKGNFQLELLKVLEEVIDRIGIDSMGINSAIYLLHGSAAIGHDFLFYKAKQYLLEFKYLSKKDIFLPPSYISISDNEFDEYFSKDEDEYMIKDMKEFSQECMKIYKKDEVNTSRMALLTLSDEGYVFRWNKDLMEALWSNIPNNF